MLHKLRQGGLKVQHGILKGLKPVLEKVLRLEPEAIKRIVPGEIHVTKGHGQGKDINVRITTPLLVGNDGLQTGWKAIALASGSQQDVFVSTYLKRYDLERVFEAAGAQVKSHDTNSSDKYDQQPSTIDNLGINMLEQSISDNKGQ
jgi:hypothetical protein